MKLIHENILRNKITDTVKSILKETIDIEKQKELRNQIAREVLGTNSFEEFYKNTGFWVSGKDYYLMSEYFKRLAEIETKIEGNQ